MKLGNGWSDSARALPVGRWITAQVLLVSTQSVHVMLICRYDEWSAYADATWTDNGFRNDKSVMLDDIAAWRELGERDHVPSHVPRRKRLAVVAPSTVTGVGTAECVNGTEPSAPAASSAGSTPSADRVGSPAPIPSRRGFAVVAAADPERIGSGDGRRATEAGPTGGVAGDTSAAGKPGPNADGARRGGPEARQGGSVESATVHAGGRPALRTCATTGALVRSGEPGGNSESARRTSDHAGGRPAHFDLPPGPTEAEREASDAAYAARVRRTRFADDVRPGVPDRGPGIMLDDRGPFRAPPT